MNRLPIIGTGGKHSCDVNQEVNGGKHWLGFGIDVGKTHYNVMQDKMCEVATCLTVMLAAFLD